MTIQVNVTQPIRLKASIFLLTSAFLVALTSIAVIWGWFIHNSLIVQIRPDYSPMKFNSAASLLFVSLALAAVERDLKRIGVVLALFGLTLPAVTLLEYVTGTNLGADTLFFSSFIETKVQYAGRMAPNTSLALLLTSLALIGTGVSKNLGYWSQIVIALIGSIVFSLGAVPLIGYIGGIESAHTWGQYTGMAAATSICFILLGLSLVVFAWKQSVEMPSWLAGPVAIGFLIVAFSMWQAIKSAEDLHFEQSLQQEAEYISNRASDRLTAFYSAIDRIDGRWEAEGGTARNLWELDVSNYLKAYPFLKSIAWVDPSSTIQWVEPLDPSKSMIGSKVDTDATRANTLELARTSHSSAVTDVITLQDGQPGFMYVNPLMVADKMTGYLVSFYSVDDIIGRILARDKNGPFYVTVTDNDVVVFTNVPSGFASVERWKKSVVLKNRDKSWLVTVQATPEILAKKNSTLPMLVLVTGILTAIFAAFSVLFAFRSDQAALLAKKASLQVQEDERRLREIIAITSAIGSPDFELQSFMDSVVTRMLNLSPASGVVIALIDFGDLVYKAVSGTLSVHIGTHIKREGSLSGLCADQNEALVSNDTSKDDRVSKEACRILDTKSIVCVPLAQRGMVVGVLSAVSPKTNAFSDKDLKTLQVMASLLGSALGQELEIERRRKLEGQLRYLAQFDPLTGLPNRALFKDRLSQAIINNRRNDKKLAVFYLDIDHFKNINDKYGHAEGDALLKSFGTRITEALRKGDTLARLGGDEFVVIAENLHGPADAESIATKIKNALSKQFELPTISVKVEVSQGIAISTQPEVDADNILGRADEALYEVKRAGRNGHKIVEI